MSQFVSCPIFVQNLGWLPHICSGLGLVASYLSRFLFGCLKFLFYKSESGKWVKFSQKLQVRRPKMSQFVRCPIFVPNQGWLPEVFVLLSELGKWVDFARKFVVQPPKISQNVICPKLGLVVFGWVWLGLVGSGCLWLALVGSGWVRLPLVGFGCLWLPNLS